MTTITNSQQVTPIHVDSVLTGKMAHFDKIKVEYPDCALPSLSHIQDQSLGLFKVSFCLKSDELLIGWLGLSLRPSIIWYHPQFKDTMPPCDKNLLSCDINKIVVSWHVSMSTITWTLVVCLKTLTCSYEQNKHGRRPNSWTLYTHITYCQGIISFVFYKLISEPSGLKPLPGLCCYSWQPLASSFS